MHFKTKTKGQYILAVLANNSWMQENHQCFFFKVEEIPNKFGQSNVIMILQEWFRLKIQK
jgi:hypothetical protein